MKIRRRKFGISSVILIVLAVAALCFIWGNSMVPGRQSDAISIAFRDIIANKLHLAAVFSIPENAVIRKLAHVTEFTVLGIVLTWLLKGKLRISCGWVLLAGMSVALADETIQLWIGSRTSSVKDVWIDMGGICAGTAIVMLIIMIAAKARRR